jgi:hypothetical protein
MTDEHEHEPEHEHGDDTTVDPLTAGVKRAAVHLTKAGFEIYAALGALSKGVVAKVRPNEGDDDSTGSGPQRINVD